MIRTLNNQRYEVKSYQIWQNHIKSSILHYSKSNRIHRKFVFILQFLKRICYIEEPWLDADFLKFLN